MIKAVFFDLYHTLIHFHPPREEVLAASLDRWGIANDIGDLKRAIVAGDEFFYQENASKNQRRRTEAEAHAFWREYYTVILKEAGIDPLPELVGGVLAGMQGATFERVLFSDVIPALSALSGYRLIMGVVSNVDQDISPLLEKLGLSPYLAVILTSRDVGVTKPEPHIFLEAVRRAGVAAADTLYVGDQYQIDVLGARGAGLRGLLLDRDLRHPEISAMEKINSLGELEKRVRQ